MRLLILLVPLLLAAPAPAATFLVNTTDDTVDASPGDTNCADAAGACSLRAAVQEANANPADPDQIDVPAGTYQLRLVGADEDFSATGDLDLNTEISITGAGAELTIVKGKKDRVFDVGPAGIVTIQDLTITKGKLGSAKLAKQGVSFDGGGIRSEGGSMTLERVILTKNKSFDDGGAIGIRDGTSVLTDVLISKNKVKDDGGGIDQDGGDSTLTNVTFEKNKAKDEGGGAEVEAATFTATNVTFSQNKGENAGGLNAEEDSLDIVPTVVTLTNVTFYKNKAKDEGGGIQRETGVVDVQLTNVVLHQNKKANCRGAINSNGGNIDTGASCLFADPEDQSNVGDAGLEKLGLNGGPTPTNALSPTSSAVDGGVQIGCPATDQRGQPRDDGACDSGAFEL